MSESANPPDSGRPAKRGHAAWKAELDRIAERNAKVSKRGREQRAAHEREIHARRRAAEARANASLRSKSDFR